MKKISRREALKLIGLSAAGGFLAACAPKTAEPTPVVKTEEPKEEETTAPPPVDEVVTIDISAWDIIYSFPEDSEPDEIHQYVLDRFKIEINPINMGWSDFNEKYNTWAASGQLPEVIGAVAMPGSGRYYQWINDGVVRPLPDTSNYLEVNKALSWPESTAFQVGGENYFLPRMTYSDPAWWAMDRGLTVRADWMDKMGIDDPETEEEYIDMLVRFATEDPDGNGTDDTVGCTIIGSGFLYSQGWTGFGYTDYRWMKDADGNYSVPTSGEKAFYMYQFYKRMLQAGGLDPDFATIDNDQAQAKFASGKAGMLLRQVSPKHLDIVRQKWVALQPNLDYVESIRLLHGPTVDGTYTRFSEKAYWSETYIEASVDDVKMDRILQLYDWLYSEDGLYTMQFGVSGKDYVIDKDGNVELLTPIDEETGLHTSAGDIYPFIGGGMSYLAAWTGDLLQYVNPNIPQDLRDLCTAERDHRVNTWKDPGVDYAIQAIDVPEKEEMGAVNFGEDWIRFIADASGTSDRDLYEDMKANWDANGYAAAVEAVTAKAKELGLD